MQTFLPYENFARSARCLDDRRLGKQRVEALQLVRSHLEHTGWSSNPASLMWKGFTLALSVYGLTICAEWERRGFQDTVEASILRDVRLYVLGRKQTTPTARAIPMPPWLGSEAFHRSHQSNLYRKDPVHYSQFRHVGPDLPYLWPKGAA